MSPASLIPRAAASPRRSSLSWRRASPCSADASPRRESVRPRARRERGERGLRLERCEARGERSQHQAAVPERALPAARVAEPRGGSPLRRFAHEPRRRRRERDVLPEARFGGGLRRALRSTRARDGAEVPAVALWQAARRAAGAVDARGAGQRGVESGGRAGAAHLRARPAPRLTARLARRLRGRDLQGPLGICGEPTLFKKTRAPAFAGATIPELALQLAQRLERLRRVVRRVAHDEAEEVLSQRHAVDAAQADAA